MTITGQKAAIWKALTKGRTLTAIQALALCGTMKLSTRIGELERLHGVTISRRMVERNGKRFAEYWYTGV
jgi:hypothetical protein